MFDKKNNNNLLLLAIALVIGYLLFKNNNKKQETFITTNTFNPLKKAQNDVNIALSESQKTNNVNLIPSITNAQISIKFLVTNLASEMQKVKLETSHPAQRAYNTVTNSISKLNRSPKTEITQLLTNASNQLAIVEQYQNLLKNLSTLQKQNQSLLYRLIEYPKDAQSIQNQLDSIAVQIKNVQTQITNLLQKSNDIEMSGNQQGMQVNGVPTTFGNQQGMKGIDVPTIGNQQGMQVNGVPTTFGNQQGMQVNRM